MSFLDPARVVLGDLSADGIEAHIFPLSFCSSVDVEITGPGVDGFGPLMLH